ncbi:hypothetical protein SARC_10610 [Sphaeroforma arctica JP610]|uniref:Uncharacterized protein n=1 Tax=Sphaeroforma arctica JP610 TaxID=667725 RepID=A0A0L0FLL4_9EUKA|nr:hypothetical protein SARC_10610 [Sphaeroforma arctica JP610]KNC76913.1 hypothetical protein SARC_10610 [Sphaeroforma arctica JP610]|eukprot:XP_014150815.1 hypothetical protein SARC_10610 [Sphaeroforma arctica JP610]
MNTLNLDILATLLELKSLDLRHNNAICEPSHLAVLANQMGGLGVDCPFTLRAAKSEKLHAADRDATLLRSQLTPHSTGTLRRRLALVFGDTTDPDTVDREGVVQRLLSHYERMGPRQIRRIKGIPVPQATCTALLKELDKWSAEDVNRTTPRERLNVRAQHYMILTSPAGFANPDGIKALRAKDKLAGYMRLWELAREVAVEADPEFATRYTAVAFTKNFQGSPHIDTQNIATFRGLALGDFSDGGGALAVECSANEVAYVDTRHRLGKVDGRYPHWVAPYTGTRYSVIYYQTRGEIEPRTTAVFAGESLVHEPTTYCRPEDKYYNKYNRETNTYTPAT